MEAIFRILKSLESYSQLKLLYSVYLSGHVSGYGPNQKIAKTNRSDYNKFGRNQMGSNPPDEPHISGGSGGRRGPDGGPSPVLGHGVDMNPNISFLDGLEIKCMGSGWPGPHKFLFSGSSLE